MHNPPVMLIKFFIIHYSALFVHVRFDTSCNHKRSVLSMMADSSTLLISTSKFSSTVDETKFHSTAETDSSIERHCGTVQGYYEVEKCIQCIKDNNFSKVALQFPDSQLCDASKIAQIIEEYAQCKVYILADTSYGSCCVDEIAAEHVKADLIIHFGPSCLSRTERIPVLYIFGKESFDIKDCCQSFKNSIPDKDRKVLLIYEVVYHHAIAEIHSKLVPEYKYLVSSSLNCPRPEEFSSRGNESHDEKHNCGCQCSGVCVQPGSCQTAEVNEELKELSFTSENNGPKRYSRFGRTFTLAEGFSLEDYTVFYIGQESLTLTNHMMSYTKCQFFTYNPKTNVCHKEMLNVNRMLMKRYYLIERAKDSNVVGILVGTLGIANYLSAITRIKKLLRQAGKKYYTFVIGKLNAEKLANFMEIDVFVLIACPENSLINSQDFYKPIVTPFEIEIACTRARQWTGEYITDFQELLPGAAHHVEIDDKEEEEEPIPDISLISGQLRHVKVSSPEDSESTSLVKRNQDTTLSTQHHSTAVEFLGNRSWKGLDPNKGGTTVSKAVEGRKGIAAEYTHEHEVYIESKNS